ncbi:hypothetical protein EHS43_24355 [Streptomyces sp. RP5T]|nr:hypothetical protein EHS43_24355 [Streptomyces sp. RP5T]
MGAGDFEAGLGPVLASLLTWPDVKARPAPDLIGRDFRAERPGIKLVGDITYLPTAEGWLYLACWLDLATREVVGYAMADHHRAELVVDALDMAYGRGGLEPGRVIHSDRGSEGGFNRSSQHLDFGGVQDRYGGLEQEDRRCARGASAAVACRSGAEAGDALAWPA